MLFSTTICTPLKLLAAVTHLEMMFSMTENLVVACVVLLKKAAGNAEEGQDKTYYVMLPPELCLVHPLPGPLVRSAQSLPSIMRRVESMLLAIQLKHEIGYQISATRVFVQDLSLYSHITQCSKIWYINKIWVFSVT